MKRNVRRYNRKGLSNKITKKALVKGHGYVRVDRVYRFYSS